MYNICLIVYAAIRSKEPNIIFYTIIIHHCKDFFFFFLSG